MINTNITLKRLCNSFDSTTFLTKLRKGITIVSGSVIEEDSTLSKDILSPGELEQDEPIEIPRGPDDNSAGDRKLFLGGLSWETKEPQLKDYFEKFGEIESINLKLDPLTGRSRCFAFLVFKESSSIDQVQKD